MPKILIADDEAPIMEGLCLLLEADGYQVEGVLSGEDAWARLSGEEYALILSDLRLPGLDGLELLSRMREGGLPTEMILITGQGSVETALEAMRRGAYDYLEKPLRMDRLRELIPKALDLYQVRNQTALLERRLRNLDHYGEMLGSSAPMRDVYTVIEHAAPSRASIFILGESGTGKELVARAIHDKSPRKKGPFIALNCGAFPREILENELFGHEKGAFTGAVGDKPGSFELAHGGTLFLDEVAEMEPDIQVKFLRALESRSFRRLGGKKEIHVDIRVVAATNQSITRALEEGSMRDDLYHRLAVIPLPLPPLRDRGEDRMLLAESFLRRYAEENHKEIHGFSPEARTFVESYGWPGNVRELKNAVERAVILSHGEWITLQDLRAYDLIQTADREVRLPLGTSLAEARRILILKTFSASEGDLARAASLLEVPEEEVRQGLSGMIGPAAPEKESAEAAEDAPRKRPARNKGGKAGAENASPKPSPKKATAPRAGGAKKTAKKRKAKSSPAAEGGKRTGSKEKAR